ncbi:MULTISPECIES: helix-turn-helix transcriptional regulator [Amycolatopsis]|uniref:Helix-turn-helix domain-containing protein n=2 Tax=Amycolatopsis TaxID=1813 RepID=A0A1I3WI67_9PSEU|nr:helix-turn-helix transcriptional regulator [Amycolatopsis sacchari]SFK07132.1 Helix-turn-helix domain-containing protein [Amycolatopsis sacchari]
MDRSQLADFLRRRREALEPEEVGLTRGTRRRAPGLRREEVAMLCDMSVDYYSRLEQARSSQPSQQMLAAIARGLRLTVDERDHLFRLAGQNPPTRTPADSHVAPGLMRLLDRLSDTPVVVMSGLGETLLQTSPARALFGDERTLTGLSRIAAYRWFTDPSSRSAYLPEDHAVQSGILTADLRAAYGTHGPSSIVGSVVDALLAESPEFAGLWAKHDVTTPHSYEKRLQHPEVGLMSLHCQILHDHQQGQSLIVFTALPGSDSQQKLDLLAVLGSERFAPERGH